MFFHRALSLVALASIVACGSGCGSASTSTSAPTAATATVAVAPSSSISNAPQNGPLETPTGADAVVKGTSCKEGELTYLGFSGKGPPTPALVHQIKMRFPDAVITEFSDGMLGVVISEPHSFEVRARHEAAAEAVGWKGNVVDFPHVEKNCEMAFHTPAPPPLPPPAAH